MRKRHDTVANREASQAARPPTIWVALVLPCCSSRLLKNPGTDRTDLMGQR